MSCLDRHHLHLHIQDARCYGNVIKNTWCNRGVLLLSHTPNTSSWRFVCVYMTTRWMKRKVRVLCRRRRYVGVRGKKGEKCWIHNFHHRHVFVRIFLFFFFILNSLTTHTHVCRWYALDHFHFPFSLVLADVYYFSDSIKRFVVSISYSKPTSRAKPSIERPTKWFPWCFFVGVVVHSFR